MPEEQASSPLLKKLFEINASASSGGEALRLFASLYGVCQKKLQKALVSLYKAPLSSKTSIKTLPGALLLLKKVAPYRLFLVSHGEEPIQRDKLKKAGIEPPLFCKIQIGDFTNKKKSYQTILREEQALQSQTVVVGDRVERDLTPAKELGLWTVQMKWGRGAKAIFHPDVDFQIEKPLDLLPILRTINSKV